MFRRVLLYISVLIVAAACQENALPSPDTNGSLSLSVSVVNIDAAGNIETEVVVTSESEWKLSVPVSWLTVEPASGNPGETTLSVTCGPNDGINVRKADVLVFTDSDSKSVSFVQAPRAAEFSCSVSEDEVYFDHAYDYVPLELEVTVGEDPVEIDLSGAPWIETEGDITSVAAQTMKKISIVPAEPNFSNRTRTGVVRLVGRTTKEVAEIKVSQAGSFQDKEESLRNLWHLSNTAASTSSWRSGMTVIADKWDKGGLLSIEASVNSNVEILADGNKCTFEGMRKGDAILLRTPVKALAAGTDVSALLTLAQKTRDVLQWEAEYWDKDKWNHIGNFTTCNESSDFNHAAYICDFTLSEEIRNDYVKLRFRLLTDAGRPVHFIPSDQWYGAAMVVNATAPAVKDSHKVLVLGNSFTYYWASAFTLKMIARSQGHRLDIRTHSEPGISLLNHARAYSLSKDIIKEGGYDVAILQEVSTTHARYADGSNTSALSEAQILAGDIMASSPSCRIILENTWAYSKSSYMGYGNYASFDEMLRKGCSQIASAVGAEISPIGYAFEAVRKNHTDIKCLHTDSHHPSVSGIYLKSCVNYLSIFGVEAFDEPAEDGELSHDVASRLRETALNEYHNFTNH